MTSAMMLIVRANDYKTSGAKVFSNMAGAPVDKPLLDNQPDLFEIQKGQQAPYSILQKVRGSVRFE